MMDSFVDTGMDTATEWGSDCIKTNLPKVLDQMSSYVKGKRPIRGCIEISGCCM